MLICEDLNFVYMAPKKTGSTTVRTLLGENYNMQIWKDYPDNKALRDRSVSPDWRSEGPDWKHVCHLPERFKDAFIFATVRSPYHLEISRYLHDIRHEYIDCSFDKFVRRLVGVSRPPTLFWKLHQNEDYIPPAGCVRFDLDVVLRLEHLNEDLKKLPFYKMEIVVGHHHKSYAKKPGYRPDTARIIKEAYREDFEAFGYDPEDYPTTRLVSLL